MINERDTPEPPSNADAIAMRLMVTGQIQGVGFRPAMARLAGLLALTGEIRNTRGGVDMILEGTKSSLQQFVIKFRSAAPLNAVIETFYKEDLPACGRIGIDIPEGSHAGPIQTMPPGDLMVCRECLGEMCAEGNRRYHYPFTSCVRCGPRYSILEGIPYQKSSTTMVQFPLCAECKAEFSSPADRRFHAETIACPTCGPSCTFTRVDLNQRLQKQTPIDAARSAILRGEIVGLKGLGGFQFLVDATNPAAVKRLRERKRRPAKPLAVLVDSLETAKSQFSLEAATQDALSAASGPIVLARPYLLSGIAPEVAPGLAEIGVMLATTPLHFLIAHGLPPLVTTSGNLEGEPIAFELENSRSGLEQVADCFIEHNRPIRRPIDDSVVRIIAGKPVTLRLGRGLAPLSLEVAPFSHRVRETPILAVGGQQNNAIAIWNGHQAVLGPHVGDLDEMTTCERWHEHQRDLCNLFDTVPAIIVHDLHPDYYSSRWAVDSKLPTISVQHHHAHIVAGMLEHHWFDREVLGIAWDGNGLGIGGELWGGEFLRATASSFTQVARLRPYSLPGGESAIRHPWRVALSLLTESLGRERAIEVLVKRGYDLTALGKVSQLLERPQLMPQTSSVGRLFDAVAVIAFPRTELGDGISQYEGSFAMFLESACQEPIDIFALSDYPLPLVNAEIPEFDWRPLIATIVRDCEYGASVSLISQQFHLALAKSIVALSNFHANLPIVLGGGVFQNRILTEMVLQLLEPIHREIGAPGKIPPGDGGLAAGQLAIALARLAESDGATVRTQKAVSSCV